MRRHPILPVIGLLVAFIAPCIAWAGSQLQSARDATRADSTVATAASAPAAATSDWRTDIRRHAQRMIEAGFVPGMQIAVTQGDSRWA